MNGEEDRQVSVPPRLDELFRFVWDRTADAARAAEDRGDFIVRDFALGTLRVNAGIRTLPDGASIGSVAAERYLRRSAAAHSDHPAFKSEWRF